MKSMVMNGIGLLACQDIYLLKIIPVDQDVCYYRTNKNQT